MSQTGPSSSQVCNSQFVYKNQQSKAIRHYYTVDKGWGEFYSGELNNKLFIKEGILEYHLGK